MMNDLKEIEGVEGIYKIAPQKIMYEFFSNSNYMYCRDYNTKEITKEIKIKEKY